MIREGKDIFGFESKMGSSNNASKNTISDKPIIGIHSDVIVEFMLSNPLEGPAPVSEFSNQVRWGSNTGAVEMVISPFGSYKAIIRKAQPDLEGRHVWACKRIMPFKDLMNVNEVVDDRVADTILVEVDKVRREETRSPSHEYSGLASLTRKAANVFKRRDVCPDVFIFRGIKEAVTNRSYMIFFELRGHGVEAPGASRVEQFVIEMNYSPSTGMIRSFGYEVQSPTRGHRWYPQPSEWDEYFSSGQPDNEIVECIAGALSTY